MPNIRKTLTNLYIAQKIFNSVQTWQGLLPRHVDQPTPIITTGNNNPQRNAIDQHIIVQRKICFWVLPEIG